jgi:hypothetical protein
MLVYFDDEETIIENLKRIIPSAVSRGFLPAECSADSVKLVYDGRQLNLNVTFDEQSFSVPERSILNIQDRSSTVKIRITYKPDNFGERSDTVFVNPTKLLGDELSKFLSGISGEYKFYRRKAKKFNLVKDHSKLKLGKSLVAQNIETGFDASLAPRLFFRWPPGKALIGTVSTIFVLVLAFVAWRLYVVLFPPEVPTIEKFRVTFTANAEAHLVTPDTILVLLPDSPQMLVLSAGTHEFEVVPRLFPIFPYRLTLVSVGALSDSVAKSIDIQSRFADAKPISLVITGYQGGVTAANRIREDLLINGYPRPVDDFGRVTISLPRGVYEIKYPIDDDLLDEEKLRYDHTTVLRPTPFRFDFSEYEGDATFVTLQYKSSR